jgi:predicted transcriptional regulator
MAPKDKDRSSQITNISSGAIPLRAVSVFTLKPELFIKVIGIRKSNCEFSISAFANRPWFAAEFRQEALYRAAKASRTRNPKL